MAPLWIEKMDKGDSVGDNTPNSKDSGKHYI
jgi:hypothetical protein